MSSGRNTASGSDKASRLEIPDMQDHNRRRTFNDGELDQRVVALVKLLARLAAEDDFRADRNGR